MCTEYIHRHIRRLPATQIVTTRELLQYGSRAAVDQALYRMVKSKFLRRLARGVFLRDANFKPSAKEIAYAKAAAFGRRLIKHAAATLSELGFQNSRLNLETNFAVDTDSSSFWTIWGRIYLHAIGPRKFSLASSVIGERVYALWHLGASRCRSEHVTVASRSLRRTEREELRHLARFMPAWLHELYMLRYPAPHII